MVTVEGAVELSLGTRDSGSTVAGRRTGDGELSGGNATGTEAMSGSRLWAGGGALAGTVAACECSFSMLSGSIGRVGVRSFKGA